MSTIFISHSSADKEIAVELAELLTKGRHTSVFLDIDPEAGIGAGKSWERTLYRKLRSCRAVVALITDHWLESYWCFAEVALARMEGKHVIPVLVDPLTSSAKIPAILTLTQYIDLTTSADADPEETRQQGYLALWRTLEEHDLLGIDKRDLGPNPPPYLGLDTFQRKHAALFFGRDEEIRAGLRLLRRGAPGLIMVVGASGSGKSSLVRAGIVPRLLADEERWVVVEPCRPGLDPFSELASSLESAFQEHGPVPRRPEDGREEIRAQLVAAAAARESPEVVGPSAATESALEDSSSLHGGRLSRIIEELMALKESHQGDSGYRMQPFLDWSLEDLRRIELGLTPEERAADRAGARPNALVEMANRIRRFDVKRRNARVLLIVDQFEELLATEDSGGTTALFLRLLRASVEAEGSPVMVLGTMRSDFLGAFQSEPELGRVDFEALSVGSMTDESLREVITGPQKLGLIRLGDGLTEDLLADTGTSDALPLLSFTLWKLWRDHGQDGEISRAEYELLGGLHRAVAEEADELLRRATSLGKADDVRQAFLKMVRVTEDGAYARKPVSWDDPTFDGVRDVLELFVERRLLSIRGEGALVEVTHESLFRSWEPLRAWLHQHRSALLLLQQIKRDAEVWDEAERDPEILWSGGRLARAVELLDRDDLPEMERQFVRDSEEKRTKQEREQALRRRQRARAKTGVSLALAGAAAFSFWRKVEADEARARAMDLARVSVAAERLIEDPNLAALTLLELEDAARTPFASLRMRQALNRGLSTVLEGGGGQIRAAVFSPDGARVAMGGTSGVVLLSNADGSGVPVRLAASDSVVTSLTFDSTGDRLLATYQDGTTHLWEGVTRDTLSVGSTYRGDGSWMLSAAFGPDGSVVFTSKQVEVRWPVGAGLESVTRVHDGNYIETASFSPDGRFVVTGGDDGTARIWNADLSGEPVILRGHKEKVTVASFSPDGRFVLTASYDGTARVWRSDGMLVSVLTGHTGKVFSAAFSPAGDRVVTASGDSTARVWRIGDPSNVTSVVLTGHTGEVTDVVFSPDGERVLTASGDGTARVWRADDGGNPVVLAGHSDGIVSAMFDGSGERVLTASLDGTARMWNSRGKSDPVPVAELGGASRVAAFDWSGSRVATISLSAVPRLTLSSTVPNGEGPASRRLGPIGGVALGAMFTPLQGQFATRHSNTALVWDSATGRVAKDLPWGAMPVRALAFSRDGSMAVTIADSTVRIWALRDGNPGVAPLVLGTHADGFTAAFDPDGTRVATTSLDGTINVWSTITGGVIKSFSGANRPMVGPGAFSSDGSRLVTWDTSASATVWSFSRRTPRSLDGHQASLTGVAFSPDGRRIVTSSMDGSSRIWNVGDDDEPVVLVDDGEPILSAAFSADSKVVFTISTNGTLRRWSTVSYGALTEALKASTSQCLQPNFRESFLGMSPREAMESTSLCEAERGRPQ
jgi:WD40 repeat protein